MTIVKELEVLLLEYSPGIAHNGYGDFTRSRCALVEH